MFLTPNYKILYRNPMTALLGIDSRLRWLCVAPGNHADDASSRNVGERRAGYARPSLANPRVKYYQVTGMSHALGTLDYYCRPSDKTCRYHRDLFSKH